MKLHFLLLSLGFIASVSCRCDVSAPEQTLAEQVPGCNSRHRTRTTDCVLAMDKFCNKTSFPGSITTFGASREHDTNKVSMSCVRSAWSGWVPAEEAFRSYGHCRIDKTQHRDCLIAIHRYCRRHAGNAAGGIIGRVGQNQVEVHCFRAARKETVSNAVLQGLNLSYNPPFVETDHGFSAVSRFCNRYYGHSGGIPVEVYPDHVTVACYDAEFSGDVFIHRTADFYRTMLQANEVCQVDFDIPRAEILNNTPDLLNSEVYDNRNSDTILESSFEVSKEVTEISSFSFATSLTLGVESTFRVGIPFIASGTVRVSSSFTASQSLTRENQITKRYVQTSPVHVPPGTRIVKEAKITTSRLQVPWTAQVINGLGSIRLIHGMWNGVSTHDLHINQRNI